MASRTFFSQKNLENDEVDFQRELLLKEGFIISFSPNLEFCHLFDSFNEDVFMFIRVFFSIFDELFVDQSIVVEII